MIRPIRNIIFVKPIGFYQSQNNLIIPDLGTATIAPTSGVVAYCGDKCIQVKQGDTVMFEQGTGLRQHWDGVDYLVLDEEHCQVIVDNIDV